MQPDWDMFHVSVLHVLNGESAKNLFVCVKLCLIFFCH